MTDDQLKGLLGERRDNACEIRLGMDFAHGVSGALSAAEAVARDRSDRISRGERTVNVYRGGELTEQLIANRDQVRKLILAGARPAPADLEAMELAEAAEDGAG